MTFAEKIAALSSNYLGSYPLDDATDLRKVGAAFPFKRNYDDLPVVAEPTLPDAAYPIGAMYRDSASTICNVYKNVAEAWVLYDTKSYALTLARDSGGTLGADELNTKGFVQNGVFYAPRIDDTVYYAPSGLTKSLIIDAPSGCDQNAGGYVDFTILGHDVAHIAVGPHNGGDIYTQYMFRSSGMIQDFGGGFTSTLFKTHIWGAAPTTATDYLGSSPALASVLGVDVGWGTSRDGLYIGYTRQDHPDGASGVEDVDERTILGTLYQQTGALCPYNAGGSYSFPPCIQNEDLLWDEITERHKLQAVASDFVVSGNTLSRGTDTFTAGATGSLHRYVYIVGDGYFKITGYTDAQNVTIDGSPAAGSGKSVFISAYPNSILQRWINGQIVVDNTDQRFAWDYDGDTALLGFGQIRLLNQMTNKTPAAHAAGAVWYSGLIFAKAAIPMMHKLERTAARMAAGSFVKLHEQDDGSGLVWSEMMQGHADGTPVGTIFAFASQGIYDSVTDKIHFVGSPHYQNADQGTWRMSRVSYDAPTELFSGVQFTNAFIYQGSPWFGSYPPFGHAYNSNAIDEANRKGYFNMKLHGGVSLPNSANVWDLDTGTIDAAGVPDPAMGDGEPDQEFFPERDELLRFQSAELKAFDFGTQTWSSVESFTFTEHGVRGPVLVYSSLGCVVIFGGGDSDAPIVVKQPTQVHRYNSNGTVTRMADAPLNIKTCTNSCVVSADPVTGEILVIQSAWADANWDPPANPTVEFWSYHPLTDVWTELSAAIIPTISGWWTEKYPFAVIGIPLARYGVVMFWSAANGGSPHASSKSTVYLYRHGESAVATSRGQRLRFRN